MRNKVVKAARVQKLIWFKSEQEFNDHVAFLKSRHRDYRVDDVSDAGGGAVNVLISEQYNGNELLK